MATVSPIGTSRTTTTQEFSGSTFSGAEPKVHHVGGQEQDGHGVGIADSMAMAR